MPDGKEILAAATASPTVDDFMRRDPATLTLEELVAHIDTLRADYSRFILEQQAKKDEQ